MARCQRAKVCRRPQRKNHVTRPVERISRQHSHHRRPSTVLDSLRPASPRRNRQPVPDQVSRSRHVRSNTRMVNHRVASAAPCRRHRHQWQPIREDMFEPQRSHCAQAGRIGRKVAQSRQSGPNLDAPREKRNTRARLQMSRFPTVIAVGRVTEGFYDTALNEANDA